MTGAGSGAPIVDYNQLAGRAVERIFLVQVNYAVAPPIPSLRRLTT